MSHIPATRNTRWGQPGGHRGVVELVFTTLCRASKRWRVVRFTDIEQKQLERYQQKKAAERAGAQPETSTVA